MKFLIVTEQLRFSTTKQSHSCSCMIYGKVHLDDYLLLRLLNR